MPTVFIAGGVSYDSVIQLEHLPPPIPATVFSRSFHESVGSTGAGKALALHKLGFEATLHALIGDDEAGAKIRARFAREGLAFLPEIDPRGTERHINLMDQEGGRISIYAQTATFEPRIDLNPLEHRIAASDYVVLNIINYCRWLIPLAQSKPIWTDIHNYDGQSSYHQDFIDAADYLFVSSDSLPDYRAFMQTMIDRGKKLVVCTHGKQGSTALDAAGTWVETPALTFPLVDANGAGDSFFSGFLYGFSQDYPLERCLQLGAISGGLCVTTPELVYPELSAELLEREYTRLYNMR
jgi:acarbose 7IV-phosphotransferase